MDVGCTYLLTMGVCCIICCAHAMVLVAALYAARWEWHIVCLALYVPYMHELIINHSERTGANEDMELLHV